MIYFDHQSKSTISDQVKSLYLSAIDEFSFESLYQKSSVIKQYQEAISSIYELLNIPSHSSIHPVSSSSEGIAQVLHSLYIDHIAKTGRNQIITTKIEDADVLLSLERYASLGVIVSTVPMQSDGKLTLDAIKLFASKKTSLISLSIANRLTGVIQQINEISEFCRKNQILLHVDITPMIAGQFVNVEEIDADFITIEGSRIGAPIGIGLLINKNDRPMSSLIPAGIDAFMRGGPYPFAGLLAFKEALNEKILLLNHMCIEVAAMRNQFEEAIESKLQGHIFFKDQERLPNVSCFAIPYIHAELLLFALKQNEIYGSIGGGQSQRLEHILSSHGFSTALSKCAISFTFGNELEEQQISQAVETMLSLAHTYLPLTKHIDTELCNDSPF